MVPQRVNLQEKLEKAKTKALQGNDILAQVKNIFKAEAEKELEIEERIQNPGATEGNKFNFDLLETHRIYHISHIKEICINYRLRFLDTRYFKGELPKQALFEVKKLEKEHNIVLDGFKIMAPAKLFKLENADDPILFAPVGNDYFYLIKKWGNDLHPLRKFLMWPFKTMENLLLFSLVCCVFLTYISRELFFPQYREEWQFMMLYLFVLKGVAGLLLFYGIALGKNFSESIWRSKYYNA